MSLQAKEEERRKKKRIDDTEGIEDEKTREDMIKEKDLIKEKDMMEMMKGSKERSQRENEGRGGENAWAGKGGRDYGGKRRGVEVRAGDQVREVEVKSGEITLGKERNGGESRWPGEEGGTQVERLW